MGSGKSTLGAAAAWNLGIPFIDLDSLVEEIAGKSVSVIFDSEGEEGFARYERMAIAQAGNSGSKTIIACGGGTPCRRGNIELMKSRGTVVLLNADIERLISRLMEAPKDQRPKLRDVIDSPALLREKIKTLLVEREYAYNQADFVFDSSRLETEQEINETLGKFFKELETNTITRK